MDLTKNNEIIQNSLINIKNKYILKQIFDNLEQKQLLKIIKYNKNLQEKLDIGINNYKKFHEEIEIEIIPINKKDINNFINIPNEYKSYYHIYFNEDKKEIKKLYFEKNEKVKKINRRRNKIF